MDAEAHRVDAEAHRVDAEAHRVGADGPDTAGTGGPDTDALFPAPDADALFPAPSAPGSGRTPYDEPAPQAPLAVRMRPRTLEEIVGQTHLLRPGAPLRQLLEGDAPLSVILWGPPGTGKTTIAAVLSHATGRRFVELSAVSATVKDVRAVIDTARRELTATGRQTVLFIDEVHRFSRTQQDALLPAVENRWVNLVAATTENPSFAVVSPLLSRSLVLTLEPLSDDDVRTLLRRAVSDPRGLAGRVRLDADAEEHLVRLAGGDARRALTYLETAASATVARHGDVVDLPTAETAVDRAAVRYDRSGDQHYDVASAFIKSMRGSDVDAALHYLARMAEAGEDPRFIARRMMILASEDIGLADPQALAVAVAAAQAVAMVGWPEARIILAEAVIYLATAPKSNAVVVAIDEALGDVRRGLVGPVPVHLRDAHYPGAARYGHGQGYVYAHDAPGGVAAQQYAPDVVDGRDYYRPTGHGAESELVGLVARLRARLRSRPSADAALPRPAADAAPAGPAGEGPRPAPPPDDGPEPGRASRRARAPSDPHPPAR